MRAPSGCTAGWVLVVGLGWSAQCGDLGARVCIDQIGQAFSERGMTLIDAAPALTNNAVEFDGTGANSFGGANDRTGG